MGLGRWEGGVVGGQSTGNILNRLFARLELGQAWRRSGSNHLLLVFQSYTALEVRKLHCKIGNA